MATYRGGEIPAPDREEEALRLRGGRAPGMENTEEELNLWPEAGTERTRRPGEKGYMKERHMAEDRNPIGYPQSEPREPLEIPIGKGQLTLNPEYQPEQTMGGRVQYEHPVGNKGWSVGAHGSVDRYIGPGYEQTPIQGGGGVFVRKKFEQGGAVEQPGCKYGSSTVVTCSTKHR